MKKPDPLLVLIDTNVLLVSISKKSQYYWLYKAIIEGKFDIALTQEILSEYEEQIAYHWNPGVAKDVIRSLTELKNAVFTTVYFNLRLIVSDEEDNKFVDCAFACNADYIVTHDAHFNILRTISFPRIPIINIHQFRDILESEIIP